MIFTVLGKLLFIDIAAVTSRNNDGIRLNRLQCHCFEEVCDLLRPAFRRNNNCRRKSPRASITAKSPVDLGTMHRSFEQQNSNSSINLVFTVFAPQSR